MANKQLYQMRWDGGQTDGDQTQNTVKELLNVEIEEFGRIRARDSIVQTQAGFPAGNNAYMSYNPVSGSQFAEGWIGFITPTGLQLHERINQIFSPSGVVLNTGLTNIDPFKSEIAVYGDKFFLAAVDSNDVPLGAFMATVKGGSSRFKAPVPLIGSGFDGSASSTDTVWSIQELQMNTPNAVGDCIFDSDGFLNNWMMKDRFINRINGVVNRVSGTSDVGVIGVMTYRDDSINKFYLANRPATGQEGLYGIDAEISIKLQFVYSGGQVSRLSNGVRLFNKDWTLGDDEYPSERTSGFNFGVTLVVSEAIDPLIKGINIYRRIIDSANPDLFTDENYYLINTVWLDNESINEENSELGQNGIDKTQNGYDPNEPSVPYDSWVLQTPSGVYPRYMFSITMDHAGSTSLAERRGFEKGHEFRTELSGQFWRTRGWIRYGSTHRLWCNTHYCVDGQAKVGYNSSTPDGGYEIETFIAWLSGLFCSTKYGLSNSIETTMIKHGADFPGIVSRYVSTQERRGLLRGSYDTTEDIPIMSGTQICPDAINAFMYSSLDDSLLAIKPGTPAQEIVTYGNIVNIGTPLIMWRDTGEVSADTEASFNGVVSEDLVIQKPRHMALAGGRFIGLNGLHDNDEKPTRAWYSQYQKFGMFNKNSYMDYGARDDGVGTGLSAFRGTTIFHFSSATYIVDVSGGFDMAWRELGAYTNIGLLHSRALVETPVGVFWGDKNDIYWFTGRGVENISHMDNARRTIRDTYREMVSSGSSDIRFNYRSDLRQVWVSQGNIVMVLDIDRMAWHKHVLSELDPSIEITGIIDVDDASFYVVYDGSQSIVHLGYPDADPEFDWGIKFSFDGGVPEVVKKAKRFYVDVEGDAQFTAVVTGDDGSRISQRVKKDSDMIRFSASVRGRAVELDLKTVEGRRWRGRIESIGMSHKVKRLK